MNGTRLAGIGGLVTLLAALALAAALLTAPGPTSAAAPADCTDGGALVTVDVGRGETARLRVGPADEILVDGRQCGAATTSTADTIAIEGTGGAQKAIIDLRGETFGEVGIDVDLADGRADVLAVLGRQGDERHEVSRDAIDLDRDAGSSVALTGVGKLSFDTAKGKDHVDAGGWRHPLALQGGRGPDTLRAGHAKDLLKGGPGSDHLEGGEKSDRLNGEGGADRCLGGGGTDALLSCTPPWTGTSSPIASKLRRRMTGKSWHRGCPVGLGSLRLLELPHWTMGDRDVHPGRLVVHSDADHNVLRAMRDLFEARYPIRRMELADRYGAHDDRMMNADDTSGFNCRFVAGTTTWSQHAYGRAIDLNPIENPYVMGSHVSPPAGRPYANRSRHAAGMLHQGDAAYRAFARIGWEWGGNWSGKKDYMHFSATGR